MVPIYRCANSIRTSISPFAVIGVGCETRGGQGSASIEGQAGRRVLTHGPGRCVYLSRLPFRIIHKHVNLPRTDTV